MLHNYVKELLTKNVNINTNLNAAEGPSMYKIFLIIFKNI